MRTETIEVKRTGATTIDEVGDRMIDEEGEIVVAVTTTEGNSEDVEEDRAAVEGTIEGHGEEAATVDVVEAKAKARCQGCEAMQC